MPFKSEAQRRKFYSMQSRGEIPKSTVERWEKETKDKDLPAKVAYDNGISVALAKFNLLKTANAAKELRMKIPKDVFHGLRQAFTKITRGEGTKIAFQELPEGQSAGEFPMTEKEEETPLDPQGPEDDPVDLLTEIFQNMEIPNNNDRKRHDALDRTTAWGPPSTPAAGDAGGRLDNLGQPGPPGSV